MPKFDSLLQLWDRLHTSLWFVPGLMALGALTLAATVPSLDRAVSQESLDGIPLVFSGRPVSARIILSTIAASMITIGGVVFSMTIVSLQLASSQFGPRLLRTFLRDAGNQVVLGWFVATFLYCVLVLPSIDQSAGAAFVPRIAVSLALVQAVVGLGMLVYFIDHVAQSIHADAVIQTVGRELDAVLETLYPEAVGDATTRHDDPIVPSAEPAAIDAQRAGYLRFINVDHLLDLATQRDLIIRLDLRPGDYVYEGDRLASVWQPGDVGEPLAPRVRRCFVIDAHRTTLQDASLAFEQLTEMAVRALSAGINDPTTAVHCIDRIGSGIVRVVERDVPDRWRTDRHGTPRLLAEPVCLDEILAVTIDPIADNASHHRSVWNRLSAALRKSEERARRSADRELLRARLERMDVETGQRC